MTDWYTVGLFAGLGVALGIAVVGVLGGRRIALIAPLLAAGLGVALGVVLADVEEAIAAGLGGLLGAFGSTQLVRGVALLALVPGLGYLMAIAVPALGLRLRRREGKRYAGLRTLARD